MVRFLFSLVLLFSLSSSCVFSQNFSPIVDYHSTENSQDEVVDIAVKIANNYFYYTIISPDKIVKWKKTPICVFVSNDLNKDIVIEAFKEWEKASSNLLKFEFVNDPVASDISVFSVDKLETSVENRTFQGGLTKPYSIKDRILKAEILLITINPVSKKLLDNDKIYTILLHEIGHSIGFMGHSPYSDDVMFPYPSSKKMHLTSRDVKTLHMIYGQTKIDEKEQKQVMQQRIDAIKNNIQKDPKSIILRLNLADLYRYNRSFKQAISVYQQAIQIDKNVSQPYYCIAISYYSMGQKKQAIEYCEKALSIEPKNTTYLFTLVKIHSELCQSKKAKAVLADFISKNPELKQDMFVKSAIKIIK